MKLMSSQSGKGWNMNDDDEHDDAIIAMTRAVLMMIAMLLMVALVINCIVHECWMLAAVLAFFNGYVTRTVYEQCSHLTINNDDER